MKPRLFTSVVLGASLLGGVASSAPAPFIASFEAHDDMHAGALWRNDRPNNNNLRGVAEHQSIAVLKGGRIIVTATASYTDIEPMIPGAGLSSAEAGVLPPRDGDPGVQPQGNRVEGLCTAYQLDATQGLVKVNMAYFTDNDSPDWQNAMKTHVMPINGGAAALVQYGYDPNGVNTSTYGRVIGPNCEILSEQTLLFANNNDNLGGTYESDNNIYSDLNGVTRLCSGVIGDGNGDDDVWATCTLTTATGQPGAAAYTVKPDFKVVIDTQEARSRGTTQVTPFADMMLVCWASGNTNPPKSTRCGMVNTAPGVPNDQRLVWRQFVAQREGDFSYTTPSLAAIRDPATGQVTDKYIVSYVKVDTRNRNGKAKGITSTQTVAMQITPQGMKLLSKPAEGMFGLTDGAHPGMTTAFYGAEKRPVAFLFAGSITDGGTATAKIIGLTPDGQIEPVRALNWADGSAGGHFSAWYGQNPNTVQGRAYPVTSVMVDNPGYGTGYQPAVKTFLVAANVYQKDHAGQCGTGDPAKGTNNGTCGGKYALGLSMIPISADPAAAPTSPDDPTPTDPTAPGNNPDPTDPGTTLGGGCSTTGGGTFAMVLVGLALVLIRRRRSN